MSKNIILKGPYPTTRRIKKAENNYKFNNDNLSLIEIS